MHIKDIVGDCKTNLAFMIDAKDFINGEVITGQTSGATTTILVEDVGGRQCIFVVANSKFIEGEIIVGATSEASATIKRYRANPVQNIQQLLDYADVDKTISGFLTKFRNAFLTSIPDTLHSEVDKRNLIKNVKSLYQAKGTKRASEIFFKLLFNENAEIRYPKDNILDNPDSIDDQNSALGAMGLKPKIVH